MLDWLRKEIINEYHYSNIDDGRNFAKPVRINGRLYDKYGTACATTVVAFECKVPVQSVKQFKYILLVGVARQNPGDLFISEEEGIQIAEENALTNPIMKIEYDESPNEQGIYFLLKSFVNTLPLQFVYTKQELIELGKDVKKYNRKSTMKDMEYYHNYFVDFMKKFKKYHY